MTGRRIELDVYIAYFKDDRGNKLASSFGWSDNIYLARMFLSTHRLSRDESCTPHIDELHYDSSDFDDVHLSIREMNFYSYTPDVNSDTKIQVIGITENRNFDDNIVVVTTYDTVYSAVGSNVARVITDYDIKCSDYSNGFMEYDSTICRAMDMLKLIHWLATGGVFIDKWATCKLKSVAEVIAKYNLASYEDFDCIRYCIMTGYLIPI